MCGHDNYINPYLRRHLRTHEEIVREDAEHSERIKTAGHGPVQDAGDDVEPTR